MLATKLKDDIWIFRPFPAAVKHVLANLTKFHFGLISETSAHKSPSHISFDKGQHFWVI